MIKVNVFEAKAHFSEYLDRAARGERIVVCRHNRPVAELRPISGVRTDPRPIGPLPGRQTFDIPSSFFEPLADDDLELWEGAAPTSRSPRAPATGATRVAERQDGKGTGTQGGKRGPRRTRRRS